MSIGGFALLIAGAFFLEFSIREHTKRRQLKNNGITTNGKIVDIIEKMDEGSPYYSPVIEFKTITGKTIKFEGLTSSLKPKINQQIRLYYKKDNPLEVVEQNVTSFKFVFYLGILLSILGLLELFSIISLSYESGTPKP